MKGNLVFLALFSVVVQSTDVEVKFNQEAWVIPRKSCMAAYRGNDFYGKAFKQGQSNDTIFLVKQDALEQCKKVTANCTFDFFICRS